MSLKDFCSAIHCEAGSYEDISMETAVAATVAVKVVVPRRVVRMEDLGLNSNFGSDSTSLCRQGRNETTLR